MIVGTL